MVQKRYVDQIKVKHIVIQGKTENNYEGRNLSSDNLILNFEKQIDEINQTINQLKGLINYNFNSLSRQVVFRKGLVIVIYWIIFVILAGNERKMLKVFWKLYLRNR